MSFNGNELARMLANSKYDDESTIAASRIIPAKKSVDKGKRKAEKDAAGSSKKPK